MTGLHQAVGRFLDGGAEYVPVVELKGQFVGRASGVGFGDYNAYVKGAVVAPAGTPTSPNTG